MAKANIESQTYAPLLVAAFDFGTTFSGYAFSFRGNHLRVQTNQGWGTRGGTQGLLSSKTPTCVLLNQNGDFDSFGYEAEDKYSDLLEDGDNDGWRLFRRFKMSLHNNQTLSRSPTVEDIEGNATEALPIFAMSIRFLREHLLKALKTHADSLLETDIHYVLTVPAIWDDSAKQFMRKAAIEAGIDTARLKLALEPEAASMWCETVNTETQVAIAGQGTQYMVADIGGGTADISVHERKSDGTLKEIHRASGGPWGGINVDSNYLKTLETVFGKEALQELKSEELGDYYDILREFETKKRLFSSANPENVIVRISTALKEISERNTGRQLIDIVSSTIYGNKITIHGRDKLTFDSSIVRQWFAGPVDSIIGHVKDLLAKPSMQAVQTVLLVGGFGECQYLQERMKTELQDKRVIVPAEAGLVVLKGAVRFGHEPNIVSSRILKYTYGQDTYRRFDEKIHPLEQKEMKNGVACINHCFSVFATVNQDISIDSAVTKHIVPINPRATNITIFRSTEVSPSFTTDTGCEKLGTLKIEHSEDIPKEEKAFDITFIFGDTELLVKVRTVKSGREEYLSFDYLK